MKSHQEAAGSSTPSESPRIYIRPCRRNDKLPRLMYMDVAPGQAIKFEAKGWTGTLSVVDGKGRCPFDDKTDISIWPGSGGSETRSIKKGAKDGYEYTLEINSQHKFSSGTIHLVVKKGVSKRKVFKYEFAVYHKGMKSEKYYIMQSVEYTPSAEETPPTSVNIKNEFPEGKKPTPVSLKYWMGEGKEFEELKNFTGWSIYSL